MITRNDVIWRTTHVWPPYSVPYSMEAVHYPDGYRADCSGYTSMCWMSGPQGGSTVTLVEDGLIYAINENDLLPGDAVGQCGPGTWGAYGHIQLFEGWDGSGYWVWEQTGGGWGPHHNFYEGKPSWHGYQAWRYVHIEGDGMSEREAQLAASYATTGSDQNGPVQAPEAWSIINYSTKAIEQRLTDKLAELGATMDSQTRRVRRIERLIERLLDRADGDYEGEHEQDDDHHHPHPHPGPRRHDVSTPTGEPPADVTP